MSWSRNGATRAVALTMLAVLWGGSAVAPASTTGKGSEKLEVDVTNHCHNTAGTRHELWNRLAGWLHALAGSDRSAA